MESKAPNAQNNTRLSNPIKGCLVVFALILIAFIVMVFYIIRSPEIQKLSRCQLNMYLIGQAINRYNDVNGEYPPSLDAIKKDYLKDSSILHCPEDKTTVGKPSFIYNRPKPDSPDDFPMLIFESQKYYPDIPIKRLVLPKSGNIKTEPLGFKKALEEAKEKQKR